MFNRETIEQLKEMHLSYIAEDVLKCMEDKNFNGLSFEDKMAAIIEREWRRRKDKRIADIVREASFCYAGVDLTDIEYLPERNLDRGLITELASCRYITDGHNIIIEGATGTGKTFLATVFGMAACRNHLSTRYVRIPSLWEEIAEKRANGAYVKCIEPYKKVKLLIIDEWLLCPLSTGTANDMFEILESRRAAGMSTIFCTQFDTDKWQKRAGNVSYVDNLLDAIVGRSHIIIIGGESMRKRRGLQN